MVMVGVTVTPTTLALSAAAVRSAILVREWQRNPWGTNMAKRAVKTYQVRFETQGFKDVADALQQIQEGIRNSTAEALRLQARRQDLPIIRSQAARERDRDIFGSKFVRQGEGNPYSKQSILESLGFKQETQARKEGLTVGSAFLIGVADALEVRSPSRAMFRLGQQAAIGFRQGFESVAINPNPINAQQARDDRGRFVRSRLGVNFERDDRFIQRKDGDNEYRSRSRGRFAFENTEQSGAGRSRLEASAKIQGEIIGQHVAQAIRASLRGETQTEFDGESIQAAIKSSFQFAVTSTFSGAFQRIGEKTIADPVLNAMRLAFAENRKIDQSQKNINPGVSDSNGIGFAAKSVAFGGFQQVGSKISEIITEDFVKGLSKGFKKRSKSNASLGVESVGESVGSFVADPLGTAKDTIRERKIAKLDDSLAEAEKLAKEERVTVAPGKVKVFTVGGLGGSGIADFNENLERIGINPDIADIENTENPNTGTNIPLSDPLRFASDAILNKYIKNEVIKGQNQDAINLAAKVIAARRNNPEAKINLVGHSAGADIVQQAIAILEKGGYADNVQGIGVGGIDIGTGFDVKNFTNIAGDNDYVVKATQSIGSKPTTKDFGQVSQVGDHKLRTYFAHPDFIKALDKNLQPAAVVKILDNFYEDMIQAYGDDALPLLEEALKDGQKFAEEFDQNFGAEETARINAVLAKYNQRRVEIAGNEVSHEGIKPKPERTNTTAIVDRQFQRVQELKAAFLGQIGQPKKDVYPQGIPIEITPDTPRPRTIPIDVADLTSPLATAPDPTVRFQQMQAEAEAERQRIEQIRQRQSAPLPLATAPDPTARFREMQARAQAELQRLNPVRQRQEEERSILAQIDAEYAITPAENNEFPQLLKGYKLTIQRVFEESFKAIARTYGRAIDELSQMPLDPSSDQQAFAETVRESIADALKDLKLAYGKAVKSIGGAIVSSDVSGGNFESRFAEAKMSATAIVEEFSARSAQAVAKTQDRLGGLGELYQGEAPSVMAGSAQSYTQEFYENSQAKITEVRQEITQLLTVLADLVTLPSDLEQLRKFRAQQGLAPRASLQSAPTAQLPLPQRYQAYLEQLVARAKQGAGERILGMLPQQYGSMNMAQRREALTGMRTNEVAGVQQFRQLLEQGDRNAARQLGESLLQRVHAIRAAYEDLGKQFQGDRQISRAKGEMTAMAKELTQSLTEIGSNLDAALASAIEADMSKVTSAMSNVAEAAKDTTEKGFQIQSPSRWAIGIGQNIVKGLGQGLENFGTVKNTIENATDKIKQAVIDRLSDVAYEAGQQARTEFNDAVHSAVGQGGDVAEELKQGIQEQATKGLTFFEKIGGIKGVDQQSAQAIEQAQQGFIAIVDQFPMVKQFVGMMGEISGSLLMVMASFKLLGAVVNATGLPRFFEVLGNLPEQSIQAANELQSLKLAFESVQGSSSSAAQSLKYVSDIADQFGINIKSAEQAYLGLVATTKGTALEGFQTQQIFESFAQTAALRGLTEEQQTNMFVALQQVMSKGKLQAEEVRGQLGEIPALAFQQTLAQSLGVSLQQLDKLMSGGQISSTAIFKVAQQYESMNATSKGVETAAMAMNRMENSAVRLQRVFGSGFLAIQTKGLTFFANALDGIANSAGTLNRIFVSMAGISLVSFLGTLLSVRTVVVSLRIALVAAFDLLSKMLPVIGRMAVAIIGVNLAIEVFNVGWKQLQLSEAQKDVRALSEEFQGLGSSIKGVVSQKEDVGSLIADKGFLGGIWAWVSNVEGRTLDIGDAVRGALGFNSSAREEFAANKANIGLATSAEQSSNVILSEANTRRAVGVAKEMVDIEQQITALQTYRLGLTAADKEELESSQEALKKLQEEYSSYLKIVGDARTKNQSAIEASKKLIEDLKSRKSPYLSDFTNQQIDNEIKVQEDNIARIQLAQSELDKYASKLETSFSVFTTLLERSRQRLANFQETLTNQFLDIKTQIIEQGLSVGEGEQTIRLRLDSTDIQELRDRVERWKTEYAAIQRQLLSPDLSPQVDILKKRAQQQGLTLNSETLNAIINDVGTEPGQKAAAQGLLQLQDLQNQITQGANQLVQQRLQARQTVIQLQRSVSDFLRQLTQEFNELSLQVREQIGQLTNTLRKYKLQRAIIGGSQGIFNSIVGSVQGILDEASEIVQKQLGVDRKRLEFTQKRYDLSTRMQDFSTSVGGATEALKAFQQQLLGGGAAPAAAAETAGATMGAGSLVGITGETGRSTGPHLHIGVKGGDRRLTSAELGRFMVDGKPLSQYPITSEYGPRWGTTHRGVDYGTAIGGKITTTVPIKSVKLLPPEDTGGGGYVSEVTFTDELVVQLMHLDPSVTSAGIGRSSSPSSTPVSGGSVGRIPTGGLLGVAERVQSDPAGAAALVAAARQLNLPVDQFVALMSWESGGTLNPNVMGGDGNAYKGLIQFSPDNQQRYGTGKNQSIAQQVPAIVQYLLDRGFIPGKMDIRGAYSAILTGNASEQYWGLADSNGTTVRNAASRFSQGDHYSRAVQFLRDSGAYNTPPAALSALPEVGQAQRVSNAILGQQKSQIYLSTVEANTAALSFLENNRRTIEEIQRNIAQAKTELNNSMQDTQAQFQQYLNPDALTGQLNQLDQQFRGFAQSLYQQSLKVNDSVAEATALVDALSEMATELEKSGTDADKEAAKSLRLIIQEVGGTPILDSSGQQVGWGNIEELKAYSQQLQTITDGLEEAQNRERDYLLAKAELDDRNLSLSAELNQAQEEGNFKAAAEVEIQQERNNLQLRFLELQREYGDRPAELSVQRNIAVEESQRQINRILLNQYRQEFDELKYQADLNIQIREAQAVQAESRGGDNGIFGFRAAELRKENQLLQENLRYQQQVVELRERYKDPAQFDVLQRLLDQAAQLNSLNLDNINAQFKGLKETILDVAQNALEGFFNDIFSGTKSAGEAFRDLAKTILKYFAQMAAQNITRSLFGGLFGGGGGGGFLGGLFGGGAKSFGAASLAKPFFSFASGGTVAHYAEGGRVLPNPLSEVLRSNIPGVAEGFRKEGHGAVLGVFTPGEEVLSLRSGEAQRYQLLKRQMGPNPLAGILAGNFAEGGTVGINPEILSGNFGRSPSMISMSSFHQMQANSGRYYGGNVTVNYEIKTPDADSFRRSQYQINRDSTLEAKRVLARK